jgi:peroxin-16
LLMMGDSVRLNVEEREEMKRRTLLMLLYLLRSPFYDRYSKEKLLFALGILANKVPVVRLVVRPILEYLPIWQQIYFYVWAV